MGENGGDGMGGGVRGGVGGEGGCGRGREGGYIGSPVVTPLLLLVRGLGVLLAHTRTIHLYLSTTSQDEK